MLDLTSLDSKIGQPPQYLRDVYRWAYLTPWLAGLLNRQVVVQTILWGNAQSLTDDVLAEVRPGDRVLQPAAVYGDFSRLLAKKVGRRGHLELRDVAPLQVDLAHRKLSDLPQVNVAWGDAGAPDQGSFDAVACFFLLHEVPDDVKLRIVAAMLGAVRPGGKVIFVDYHRPRRWHPLKPVMRWIFDRLEPFATSLWSIAIEDLGGPQAGSFTWHKTTRFGGLYQTVIAERT